MMGKPEKEVNSMEDNNTTNPNEKNESKPAVTQAAAQAEPKQAKPKQPKKDNEKPSFSETVADYKAEFRKIIWPKRDELAKKTVTVIFTSLLVGVIIFCMDTIYSQAYGLILNLLG